MFIRNTPALLLAMCVVFSATGCDSQSPPDPSEKTQSQSPALLDASIVEPVKKSDEHFTLGGPVDDERLVTRPPYAHLG